MSDQTEKLWRLVADGAGVQMGEVGGFMLQYDLRRFARRIVACVNACRNLSTDMLESVGQVVTEGALPHRILTMQRDELLAAMKDAHKELVAAQWPMPGTSYCKALNRIDAAITKAEAKS